MYVKMLFAKNGLFVQAAMCVDPSTDFAISDK